MPVPGRKVYIITGPTAIGKTGVAIEIAKRLNAEIVSADSRQVYIGMDIGTAKPKPAERKAVTHHLLDVVHPDEDYNVALFKQQALEAIEEIHRRGYNVIIVGGTGLYIRALLEGLTFQGVGCDDALRAEIEGEIESRGVQAVYDELKRLDPEACEKIHPNNIPRIVRAMEVIRQTGRPFSETIDTPEGKEGPAYEYVSVFLDMDRESLYRRIERRVDEMVHSGWVDEVKSLAEAGYSSDLRAMNALGYREMVNYVEGRISLREAVESIKKATRNFAQRQLTFFRGMEGLNRFEIEPDTAFEDLVDAVEEALGIE